MEKTATLNLRVNPVLKSNAEEVLTKLGIPVSTAIDMFLNQVVLVGGIPFDIKLPALPKDVDISKMTDKEISDKLMRGYKEAKDGKVVSIEDAKRYLNKKYK